MNEVFSMSSLSYDRQVSVARQLYEALDPTAKAVILWTSVGVLSLFGLIFFIYMITRIVVVEQGTAMVIESWGKFSRKLDPGIYVLVPFMEKARVFTWRDYQVNHFLEYNHQQKQEVKIQQTKTTRIDLREQVMDFPLQQIITRDNVEIEVHPMLIYMISDPVRAVYEVYDLAHAVEKLVQTSLRSVIGDMGLDDTLASREEINRTVSQKVSRVFQNWGFTLLKVEILEILPTKTIQDAMHQQIAAERLRRAAIVTSDGFREQIKTEAEGECQSVISISKGEQQVEIIKAKAESEARIMIAKAEAESINIIANSLKDFKINATQYLIGIKFIETLTSLSLNSNKRLLYFPFETNVYGAFNLNRAITVGKKEEQTIDTN